MTAAEQRLVPEVRVYVAKSLLPNLHDWQRVVWLHWVGGSDGQGQVLGEAVFEQDYGELMPALDGSGGEVLQFGIEPNIADNDGNTATLEGKLVRLTRVNANGSETPFWRGILHGHTVEPAGDNGGKATWTAVALPSALDQITLNRGVMKPLSGTTVVNMGYLPPFNKLGQGERSAITYTVNGVTGIYVHDLTTDGTTGTPWTAKQIADNLLATFSKVLLQPDNVAYGWRWTVDDPDGCLDYVPEPMDLNGYTLLEAINTLINPRRGLTWYLTIETSSGAEYCQINVLSTVGAAISIGGYSLPMSSLQDSLDTTGDVWITDVAIGYDSSQVCDVLEVVGAHPLTGITLKYQYNGSSFTAALEKGWTSAQLTAWNVDNTKVESVWRRFTVVANWNGQQHPDHSVDNTIGLHNTFARATSANDASYGYKGLTGVRSFSTTSDTLPSAVLKLERNLPIGVNFVNDRMLPLQAPILVAKETSGVYTDKTLQLSGYEVHVDDTPPQVVLDAGDNGIDLKEVLDGNNSAVFYVTVGIRENEPLKVSWQRNPAQWPRSLPRVKSIKVANAELWRMCKDCVKGANAAGTNVELTGAEVTIRDDRDTLRSVLALARAWYTVPSVSAQWTNRGALEVNAEGYRPGTYLTTLTRHHVHAVGGIVTRRRWTKVLRDNCEMWDTSYETVRIVPDIESVI